MNCVEKNLSQFMFTNAIFLCERLLAEFPSEVSRFRLFQIVVSSPSITSFFIFAALVVGSDLFFVCELFSCLDDSDLCGVELWNLDLRIKLQFDAIGIEWVLNYDLAVECNSICPTWNSRLCFSK